MDPRVVRRFRTSARWETIDLSLRDERRMWSDPRLILVEILQCVLFLVLPFHVFLFVRRGVPPDIQKAVGPGAASEEERAEVETSTVLWYD